MGGGRERRIARPAAAPGGEAHRQRWWHRLLGPGPVIHDRRLGERRRQRLTWRRERRQGERRRPLRQDLSEVLTYLGAGSRWEGALQFRGVLRIDGDLVGPGVRGEALIIGAQARVWAPIDVDRLLVAGQVQGEIRARQRVELRATSRVHGTIWAPRVEIWPGAVLHGTCHLEAALHAGPGERESRRAVAG